MTWRMAPDGTHGAFLIGVREVTRALYGEEP